MLKLIEGNFDDPEVHKLLTKHFIELRAASPEGSAHVLDIPGLKVPSIKFWSLYNNDQLMGCGALKFLDKGHGEFKSIRIHDNFRKKGHGVIVINHLIGEAKKFAKLLSFNHKIKNVIRIKDVVEINCCSFILIVFFAL